MLSHFRYRDVNFVSALSLDTQPAIKNIVPTLVENGSLVATHLAAMAATTPFDVNWPTAEVAIGLHKMNLLTANETIVAFALNESGTSGLQAAATSGEAANEAAVQLIRGLVPTAAAKATTLWQELSATAVVAGA